MIYTIGNERSYLRAIAQSEGGVIQKTGRYAVGDHPHFPSGYPGGIVFETREAAVQYLRDQALPSYCVWGVDAQWGADTAPIAAYPAAHNLIKHADIIPLHTICGNPNIDGYHIVRTLGDNALTYTALCGHDWNMGATIDTHVGHTTCPECARRWLAELRDRFGLHMEHSPELDIGIVMSGGTWR